MVKIHLSLGGGGRDFYYYSGKEWGRFCATALATFKKGLDQGLKDTLSGPPRWGFTIGCMVYVQKKGNWDTVLHETIHAWDFLANKYGMGEPTTPCSEMRAYSVEYIMSELRRKLWKRK